MRKSWKPQIRSFIFYRKSFLFFLGLVVFAGCVYLYFTNEQYMYILLIVYVLYILMILLYLSWWKVDGYEKITINRDVKSIVFDDRTIIPFKKIRSISYIVENNPNKPILMRNDILDNGRVSVLKIHAFLDIDLDGGKNIKFHIQNKLAARGILNYLKKCGFEVFEHDKRTLNIALIIRIAIALGLLVFCAYLYFRQI